MSDEVKTAEGELFRKEKKVTKTGNDYYVLKIGGSMYTLFKPSVEAFDSDVAVALAWKVAEAATLNSILQVQYTEKGTYANVCELMLIQRAPAQAAQPNQDDNGYWEEKNKREDRRSALHAAVQHAEGKDTKSQDVIKVAKAFYGFIREAE